VVSKGRTIVNAILEDGKFSKPTHKVKIDINVMVPMRDKIKLATDVYRPEGEGKFPAILVRLPYGKTDAYCEMPAFGQYFAKRGYVFVAQDVRGKFDSEGDPYPLINEPDDGYTTQTWVAAQPWSNGKIGTLGDSYYGFTQWASAPLQNPSLRAMITVVTAADPYEEWFYINGAFQLSLLFRWLYLYWGSRANLFYGVEPSLIPINLKHLPLISADEAAGQAVKCYKDMIRHPNRDSYWKYWKGESKEYPFDQVAVPVLHIAGWHDHFLRGQLKDYVTMTTKAASPEARRNQKLVIAPCHHDIYRFSTPEQRGYGSGKNIDFGPNADPDILTLCLRWYDYWLKGIDNGIMEEPPVKIFVMGENVWRYENEWPLARTWYTKYYFHSNGKANSMYGDGVGKIYDYTLDLRATSYLFKIGHKIGLEISSSNFPRFDRNPNTGHEFGMDAETAKATQIIFHNAMHPSYICCQKFQGKYGPFSKLPHPLSGESTT